LEVDGDTVWALAVLPDGCLASGGGAAVRLWDSRVALGLRAWRATSVTYRRWRCCPMAASPTAAATVGRGICHCPEGRRLFPELSVFKNLMLGAYLRRDRPGIAQDLDKVYSLFPVLKARAGQQANTLSGGEQQMLAIGRALMGAPTLLLLDEPSVGIAQRLKVQIFQSIRTIQQAGTAVLLVEQDARSTLAIAERVYVLEHGRVVRRDNASTLAADDDIRRIYLGV
jgi:branched-chain amino acid transport system ATP-binding protein